MSQELIDYAHAAEAVLNHGRRAGQHLVDVMQCAVRTGDFDDGASAERALRIVEKHQRKN